MSFFTFVSTLFAGLLLIDLALLWTLHRSWLRRVWIRRLAIAVPIAAVISLVGWGLGYRWESQAVVRLGAATAALLFVQLLALLLALLINLPIRLAETGWDWARRWRRCRAPRVIPFPGHPPIPEQLAVHEAPSTLPDAPERRRFLRLTLAAVPVATAAAASGGILQSTQGARIPHIRLTYPDLPPALRGLRILQLSDMHIGPYVRLDDLEDLLERSAELAPDLVVVTGDICDHMPDYATCLHLIEQLRPRLGTYASLGNHEYYRGIDQVRACFAGSSIPLLVDAGVDIAVGATRLRVAGADDPVYMGSPGARGRLRTSVERSLDGADSNAFHLLMSHRSVAFDTARRHGVHLTLAGHTHGFQLGHGGRSFADSWYPELYIWGHYGGGPTQLYTSAGVGHWFPFRLGCPPEAPLFILENA